MSTAKRLLNTIRGAMSGSNTPKTATTPKNFSSVSSLAVIGSHSTPPLPLPPQHRRVSSFSHHSAHNLSLDGGGASPTRGGNSNPTGGATFGIGMQTNTTSNASLTSNTSLSGGGDGIIVSTHRRVPSLFSGGAAATRMLEPNVYYLSTDALAVAVGQEPSHSHPFVCTNQHHHHHSRTQSFTNSNGVGGGGGGSSQASPSSHKNSPSVTCISAPYGMPVTGIGMAAGMTSAAACGGGGGSGGNSNGPIDIISGVSESACLLAVNSPNNTTRTTTGNNADMNAPFIVKRGSLTVPLNQPVLPPPQPPSSPALGNLPQASSSLPQVKEHSQYHPRLGPTHDGASRRIVDMNQTTGLTVTSEAGQSKNRNGSVLVNEQQRRTKVIVATRISLVEEDDGESD